MRWLGGRWLREPLLHFALLGGLIFLIDGTLAPEEAAERRIEVTPAVEEELSGYFLRAQGRSPSAAELDGLVDRWIAEEVLYREGLAMGLERGDEIIRDRIVQRMNAVLENTTVVDPADEQTLRAWFEARRDRFDRPARYDFVTKQVRGGKAAAQAEAAALQRAMETGEGAVQPQGPLAHFSQRPGPNVSALFGVDFTAALESLPEYEWHALEAQNGWHLVRLDGIWPAEPATFEAVRDAVAADWRRSALAEEAAARLSELTTRYRVVRPESGAPAVQSTAATASDG